MLGPRELPGRDGQDGEPGSQGVAGRDGKTGPQGMKGDTGSQGLPGPCSGGVTYVRWGRTTCPDTEGTEVVYTGRAAGSYFIHTGGTSVYQMSRNTYNSEQEFRTDLLYTVQSMRYLHFMNIILRVLCAALVECDSSTCIMSSNMDSGILWLPHDSL